MMESLEILLREATGFKKSKKHAKVEGIIF